ncbi:uncharacterized protein LOC114542568 isoform X2 [Dendronephthya gigantea]|uniref:uncharacterized protein LOC114542568 isoform X2 n=1 Tax=Dendronephthya gigantea TaxID=151771 RepID=UPI00106CF8B9|nr:uncharacterized protein LOC114542568 isoform X2 [Dendronephthya gigantea]
MVRPKAKRFVSFKNLLEIMLVAKEQKIGEGWRRPEGYWGTILTKCGIRNTASRRKHLYRSWRRNTDGFKDKFLERKENQSYDSPPNQPQSSMLMTQRLKLPSVSDDELSQFTESDGGSVAGIEGIQPIDDTPSEVSEDSDDDGNLDSDAPDDHEDGNNDTLVCGEDDDGSIEEYDDGNRRISHVAPDIDCNIDDDCDDDHVIDDNGDDQGIIDDHDYHNDTKKNVHLGLGGHSQPSFDDVPIKPGLGGQTRIFEELLNQQLQTEQRSPNENEPAQPTRANKAAKKTFILRKGEGIARFGMKPKIVTKQGQATVKDKCLQNSVLEERAPVTRKTATVKDYATVNQSRSPAVGAQASKPVVAQKPEGPVARRSLRQEKPFSPKKVHFTTIPSRGSGVYLDDASEVHSESSSEDEGLEEDMAREGEQVVEDSFQRQMKKLDDLEVVEKQELNEFELLEEAVAANCSLSSNSSTVLRILGAKQKQCQADVNNNMLTARQLSNVKRKVISIRSSLALSEGFDDTKTWEEHDVLDASDVTHDVMHALNTSTPDEKRRSAQAHNKVSENTSSTPPTSAPATKLFPQLKAQSKVEVISRHPQAQELKSAPPATDQVVGLDGVVSGGAGSPLNPVSSSGMNVAFPDKFQELEKMIEKLREEHNMALHRLREERERGLQELQKERTLFESHKREELDRLEKLKTEEEKRSRPQKTNQPAMFKVPPKRNVTKSRPVADDIICKKSSKRLLEPKTPNLRTKTRSRPNCAGRCHKFCQEMKRPQKTNQPAMFKVPPKRNVTKSRPVADDIICKKSSKRLLEPKTPNLRTKTRSRPNCAGRCHKFCQEMKRGLIN